MRIPSSYSLCRRSLALFVAATASAVSLTAQSAVVPVVATETKREIVTEKFTLTGTVTPRQQASLSPRASGLVETVHVDAGAQVSKGTKLITLDSTMAQLARESAGAQHREAEARLSEIKRLLAEARNLLARNSIPETQVMTREAEVAIANAALQRAAVNLREREEMLERHAVIAPFDGVIARKLTEAGEWVTTGTPVMRLVSLDGARIDVQVPQERLAAINSETPIEFDLGNATGVAVAGQITALVPVSNPDTRSALVRIEPSATSLRLIPGKSARVTFLIASQEPVLTVPRDAVIRRADGTVNVWVANRSGDAWTASMLRVDIGRTFSDQIEVRSGLEPGQQVIIRGNETLRPGQAVNLTEK